MRFRNAANLFIALPLIPLWSLLCSDYFGFTSRNTRLPRDVRLPSEPSPYMVRKDPEFLDDVIAAPHVGEIQLIFEATCRDKVNVPLCDISHQHVLIDIGKDAKFK